MPDQRQATSPLPAHHSETNRNTVRKYEYPLVIGYPIRAYHSLIIRINYSLIIFRARSSPFSRALAAPSFFFFSFRRCFCVPFQIFTMAYSPLLAPLSFLGVEFPSDHVFRIPDRVEFRNSSSAIVRDRLSLGALMP